VKHHEALSFTCDAEECIAFSPLEPFSCVAMLFMASNPFGFIIDLTEWSCLLPLLVASCLGFEVVFIFCGS
jgi:hypothetical protein